MKWRSGIPGGAADLRRGGGRGGRGGEERRGRGESTRLLYLGLAAQEGIDEMPRGAGLNALFSYSGLRDGAGSSRRNVTERTGTMSESAS